MTTRLGAFARKQVSLLSVIGLATAGIAAIVIVTGDDEADDVIAAAEVTESSLTVGSVLAPSTPAGLDLWGVTWAELTLDQAIAGREQLFTHSGGGAVMVHVEEGSSTAPDGSTAVTVRGIAGWTDSVSDTETAYYWNEGAILSARFHGVSSADVLTFLTGLSWVGSSDHLSGFAAPSGSWTLVGQTPRQPNVGFKAGKFSYSSAPPVWVAGHGTSVHVETVNTTVTSADGVDPEYLKALYDGEPTFSGAVERYDSDLRTLQWYYSDGRRVSVDAFESSTYDLSALRSLAGSVSPVTEAQLATMRSGVSSEVATLPELSEAEAADLTLSARGVTDVKALCLTPESESPWCINLDPAQTAESQNDQIVADTVIDGQRYVVAASMDGMTFAKADPAEVGVLTPVYATGDGDGWEFGLVEVPSTITNVQIIFNPPPEPSGLNTSATPSFDDVAEPSVSSAVVVVGDIWDQVSLGPDAVTAQSSERAQ